MSVIPPRLPRALAGACAAVTAVAILAAPVLAQVAPASIDDILRQTAELRSLEVRAPVPTATMDRGKLQVLLTGEYESDMAIREFRVSGILLETLGLIPAGFDLRLFQIDLLREQVGGFYHRQQRQLYLVADDDPLGALDKTIVAHEMTHALQDQHFDLKRLLPARGISDDGLMAATALLEGDAMVTMNQWGRRFLTPAEKLSLDEPRPSSPALAAAPLIVRAELEFPYLEGLFFAIQLHQDGGGFEALNRALADPPRSTEQIIHPEKYLAREAPRPVVLPALNGALGEEWRLLRSDVLGELVLRVLIQDTLGWPDAEAAATGWGGDAYAVLEDATGRRLVILESAWDSEPDAAEFYNAYVRAVGRRFGASLRQVQAQPSRLRWSAPGMLIQALKTNDRVRLVFAPNELTLDAVDAQFAVGLPDAAATPASAPPTPAATPPAATPPAGDPPVTATPTPSPGPSAPTFAPDGPTPVPTAGPSAPATDDPPTTASPTGESPAATPRPTDVAPSGPGPAPDDE